MMTGPGPLTSLIFTCVKHSEETYVEYYEPTNPPRCSRGDLMTRRIDSPVQINIDGPNYGTINM